MATGGPKRRKYVWRKGYEGKNQAIWLMKPVEIEYLSSYGPGNVFALLKTFSYTI